MFCNMCTDCEQQNKMCPPPPNCINPVALELSSQCTTQDVEVTSNSYISYVYDHVKSFFNALLHTLIV